MNSFSSRTRRWALPVALLALTATNVVLTFAPARIARADFSDSVLFDHREYWERCLTTTYPSRYGGQTSGRTDQAINFTTDSIGIDTQLAYVWGLNDGSDGFPAAKKAVWVGEAWHAGLETEDPFSASNTTEAPSTSADFLASPVGLWNRMSIMESIVALDSAGNTLAAGTRAGMGLGFLDTLAFAINASGNFISKRALAVIYARYDNNTWEILLNKGTAGSVRTVGAIVVLKGVDPPVFDHQIRIRLVYNPIAHRLTGVINGVDGGSITDASKFPDCTIASGSTTLTGFNVFAMTGPQVNGVVPSVNMAFWYPTIRTYYAAP